MKNLLSKTLFISILFSVVVLFAEPVDIWKAREAKSANGNVAGVKRALKLGDKLTKKIIMIVHD